MSTPQAIQGICSPRACLWPGVFLVLLSVLGGTAAVRQPESAAGSNGLRTVVVALPKTIRQAQALLPVDKAPRRWPPVFSPESNAVLTLRGNYTDLRLGDSVAVFTPRGATGPVTVAVGTPGLSDPARALALMGGVVLFEVGKEASQLRRTGYLEGGKMSARFGFSLANVGDVDRDGHEDLAVGVPFARSQKLHIGGWVLVYGSSPWSITNSQGFREGPRLNGYAGHCIVHAGDLNGDGWSDVAVGAPGAWSKFRQEGGVLVYFGSPSGLRSEPDQILWGRSSAARFGTAIAAAGDVNRDGFADLLVGAPEHASEAPFGGRVDLFLGASNGLPESPSWTFLGQVATASLGAAVAGLGDINRDGFDDVIVGAPGSDDMGTDWPGAAFVFQGGATGLSAAPALVLQGELPLGMFGASFATRGDVNGDGRPDLLVGAPKCSTSVIGAGRVYLFPGLSEGLAVAPSWILDGTNAASNSGATLAFLPDANGDGCDEILIASPTDSSLRPRSGRVDVLWGSRSNYVRPDFVPRPTSPDSLALGQRPLRAGRWLFWTTVGFVTLVGLVLVWARLSRRRAVTAERTRLAREFHDDLGAQLNHISLLAELVRRDAAGGRAGEGRADQLASAAREVLERMEEVIWSVNPACDNLEDLTAFILQYAGPFLAPSGLELHPEVPAAVPRRPIPPEIRKNVFLCVKETLNNVVKHAHARQVHLKVRCSPESFEVEIADDGRGLPPSGEPGHRPGPTSDGLRNMAARMQEVGGQFTLESQPGAGTRVRIQVPC